MLESAAIILGIFLGACALFVAIATKSVPALTSDGDLVLDTQLSHHRGHRELVVVTVGRWGVRIVAAFSGRSIAALPWSQIEDVEFERRSVPSGALEGWPIVGLGITAGNGQEWLLIEERLGAEKRLRMAAKMSANFAGKRLSAAV